MDEPMTPNELADYLDSEVEEEFICYHWVRGQSGWVCQECKEPGEPANPARTPLVSGSERGKEAEKK